MRGDDQQQTAMFSYLTLAQRIPADHPVRQIRVLVDRSLARMDGEFEKLYSATGRPSIPDARLYKKATADKSVPAYQGHALTENRNGLVVAAEASLAATVAEREKALVLLDRVVGPKSQREEKQVTLGADTQYQEEKFIEALRERQVAPHVSEYTQGANMGKNSLTDEERQDLRRPISQRKRKLIERVFGWSKLDGPMRQVKLRGLKRVDWFYRMTISAYNLVRMRRLIPIAALAQ
jgi:hypothetical protein